MSTNRQNKKEIIHTILMVIDPSLVTTQLRNRILTQRGSKDQIGITTPKPNEVSNSSNTREIIFNVNLKNESSLSKLIRSQNFDTVYVDLQKVDGSVLKSIVQASQNTKVNRIIMSLNVNDQPSDPNVKQAVEIVKHGGINYTIIRRAKLNRYDLISYKAVHNAQPVNDSTVSPSSVADLVYQIIKHPKLHANVDLGIAQLPYK